MRWKMVKGCVRPASRGGPSAFAPRAGSTRTAGRHRRRPSRPATLAFGTLAVWLGTTGLALAQAAGPETPRGPSLGATAAACVILCVIFVVQGTLALAQRRATASERNEAGVAFSDFARSIQPGDAWQFLLFTTVLPLVAPILIEFKRFGDLSRRVSELSYNEAANLFAAGLSPDQPALAVLYSSVYNLSMAVFVLMVTLTAAFLYIARMNLWRSYLVSSLILNLVAIFAYLMVVPAYNSAATVWVVLFLGTTALLAYGSSFIALVCTQRYEAFRAQPRELRRLEGTPSLPMRQSAPAQMEATLK
ncbi:MAG: hypothetical protein HXY25_11675 [Alphaproteobacteria bacterium]|nr:hypothetical protein [Alphaproteobacteria bacterium]